MRKYLEEVIQRRDYLSNLSNYLDRYFNNKLSIADTMYNSNKIEGSSLTLGQTIEVLNSNIANTVEEKEVLGLNKAMDYFKSYYTVKPEINDLEILHKLLMEDIRPSAAGVFRVGDSYTYVRLPDTTIKRHYYIDHDKIEESIKELFNRQVRTIDDAILFKLDLAQIHPFVDGNGRVSRLIFNWLLIKLNYPPITFKGDEYSKERYIDAFVSYSLYKEVLPLTELVEEELFNVLKTF